MMLFHIIAPLKKVKVLYHGAERNEICLKPKLAKVHELPKNRYPKSGNLCTTTIVVKMDHIYSRFFCLPHYWLRKSTFHTSALLCFKVLLLVWVKWVVCFQYILTIKISWFSFFMPQFCHISVIFRFHFIADLVPTMKTAFQWVM